MKNKTYLIATGIMVALLAVSIVSAFGVSSPYWEGNPLNMAKGEVTTVNLNLQNMVGEKDVMFEAELLEVSDITSLRETSFTIKAQTADTFVPLKITMPDDANTGEVKTIKVEFKTISTGVEGISLGTGMTILFDVVATEEISKDKTTTIIVVVIAIIVLIIILTMLLKKKKR